MSRISSLRIEHAFAVNPTTVLPPDLSAQLHEATTDARGLIKLAAAEDITVPTPAPAATAGAKGIPVAIALQRTATETRTGVFEFATVDEAREISAQNLHATRVVTPAGVAARTATTDRGGVVRVATQDEADAALSTSTAVDARALAAWSRWPGAAAWDTAGLARFATPEEVAGGTLASVVVSAAALAAHAADPNTGAAGVVRLATQTEVNAGASTTTAVTPATLKAWTGWPGDASDTAEGLARMANPGEMVTPTSTAVCITPAQLHARQAADSPSGYGLARHATTTEVNTAAAVDALVTPKQLKDWTGWPATATAGSDGLAVLASTGDTNAGAGAPTTPPRIVTAATLASYSGRPPAADVDTAGLVQLGTVEEVAAGTPAQRVVTPATLHAHPSYANTVPYVIRAFQSSGNGSWSIGIPQDLLVAGTTVIEADAHMITHETGACTLDVYFTGATNGTVTSVATSTDGAIVAYPNVGGFFGRAACLVNTLDGSATLTVHLVLNYRRPAEASATPSGRAVNLYVYTAI